MKLDSGESQEHGSAARMRKRITLVEIAIYAVIILLIAQFPLRIVFREELRAFDWRFWAATGVSPAIGVAVVLSVFLAFIVIREVRKKKARREVSRR